MLLNAERLRLPSEDMHVEHWADFPGMLMRRALDPQQEGSPSFRMSLVTLEAGVGTPRHVHHRSDEGWYVISGSGIFHAGGRTLRCQTGDFLYAPRGFPHQVINDTGEPFHYVAITAPPCDFEGDNTVTEVYDPKTHHQITG